MNKKELYELIEKNKVPNLCITNMDGAKLMEIDVANTAQTIDELETVLPSFTSYRRVIVQARKNDNTPFTKGFNWILELQKNEAVAGVPVNTSGTIGAMEYVGMMKDMMKENFALQKEIIENKVALANNDPTKWLPIISAFAPALGLQVNPSIAGPPKQLILGDVELEKMTDEEVGKEMGKKLDSLALKIKGTQFVKMLSALDNVPDLSLKIDKITRLLNGIINKPYLLDQAQNFV